MKLKIKIKFNINWLFKIIYPLLIITIIGGMIALANFLYKDFYQTITQAEEVTLLRAQVAPDIVNIKIFDEVIKKLDEKMNKPRLDKESIKNPFVIAPKPSSVKPKLK